MKTFGMVFALFCSAILGAGTQPALKLKVASYNIQSFRGMDFTFAPQKTIEAAKRLDADLIGFQEVRHNFRDPGDWFADLGKNCGGRTFFAQTLQKKDFVYGIGSFSRLPARVAGELWLPMQGALEPRKAQFLEVSLNGKKFYFITTHMSYEDPTGKLQQAQIAAILETAETQGFLPAILTGDLNSAPDSPALQWLKSKWHVTGDAPATFPADKPDRRIDFIAVSDDRVFHLVSQQVIADRESSDHRPVTAEFDVTL